MVFTNIDNSANIQKMRSRSQKANQWLEEHSQSLSSDDPLNSVLTTEIIEQLQMGRKVECFIGSKLVEISLDEDGEVQIELQE